MAVKADRLLALGDKFDPSEIEWRLQQSGEKNGRIWAMCLAYINNRAIMNRLDAVCGPANWRNEFMPGPGGGVLCGISVFVEEEDGAKHWVTKYDGAENTDIEGVKGGLSGSMKRAAVQWNIGRYLYYLEEGWAEVTERGENSGKTKQGTFFKWNPPKLPDWALPGKAAPVATRAGVRTDEAAEGLAETDSMLRYIRKVGPTVNDQAEIEVEGETYNLKDFVRTNWPKLQEGSALLPIVVERIGEVTETAYVG